MISYILSASHVCLALACMWGAICRMNTMRQGTRTLIFLEYFLLGCASATSLMFPSNIWILVALSLFLMRCYDARGRGGLPSHQVVPVKA